MKNKLFVLSILGTLSVCAFIGVTFESKKTEHVEAYTATTTLPSTINLKDLTDNQVKGYYSDLVGLTQDQLKGNELLKRLKPILKNNQKYYKYDTIIWKMYEIIDRDWSDNKSPASEISGYNESTQTITGYTYGSSYSSPGMNPYLHSLYVNRNVDNKMRAWVRDGDDKARANHGNNDYWYIDREHIWAKSHGFELEKGESEIAGARGDPMHLWSGDSYVNSALHSNYYFGFVDLSKPYTDGGDYVNGSDEHYTYVTGNYMQTTSENPNLIANVFEPQDSDKGDIARAIFYMVARYNYLSGSDSDGIDPANPNLELTSDLSNWVYSGYKSTTTSTGKMGIVETLLAWNRLDPPDKWEIHRNNLLYNNYTSNRNPFIDYPEWAEYIWGSATIANDKRSVTSYDSTPTGSVNLNTDTINGFSDGGEQEEVPVTGVSLNKDSLSLDVYNNPTGDLTASISPNNATDQSVTWESSDTSVATVSNGTVTALKEGSTTITVTTNDGGFTDTCLVTVSDSTPKGPNAEIIFSEAGYSNGEAIGTVNFYNNTTYGQTITGAFDKGKNSGGNTTKYYDTGTAARMYAGNTLTVTSSRANLTRIEFVFGSSDSTSSSYAITANVGDYSETPGDGNSGVWSGTAGSFNKVIFSVGGTSTGQRRLAKLKLSYYDASDYASDFLSTMSCDNGVTPPSTSSWSTMSTKFGYLFTEDQETLKNAALSESGTVIERAMARYDYILKKYGTNTYSNFMNKSGSYPTNVGIINEDKKRTQGFYIAISISALLISFTTAILLIKRKKRL